MKKDCRGYYGTFVFSWISKIFNLFFHRISVNGCSSINPCKYSFWWKRLVDVPVTYFAIVFRRYSQDFSKTSWTRWINLSWSYVLRSSWWRRIYSTWLNVFTHLQDVFQTLHDVFKMSSRYLQGVLNMYHWC